MQTVSIESSGRRVWGTSMAMESWGPTETLLYFFYYFFYYYFEKNLGNGILFPKPVKLPALERQCLCCCPVCLSFCLLKAFCNRDVERGGFV